MSDDLNQARFTGQMFGIAAWVAIAAGAAILGAAGAPNAIVAGFALLAVIGLVVLGVRYTRQR